MKEHVWCRSRFWLCHFLNNRHRRAAIDWTSPSDADPGYRHNLAEMLRGASVITGHDHRWLIDQAIRQCPDDPAYIQCLRLFAKEEHFLDSLAPRLAGGDAKRPPAVSWVATLTLPIRRTLGLRFELSVLLLAELADLTFCDMVRQASDDATLRQVCRQMEADCRAHAAFHAERLTQEFADFNFVRRNLRRWRLRVHFAGVMAWSVLRSGPTIRAAGWTRRRALAAGWASFSELLERMVPYHRDALLAALLQQRDRPYDNPLKWE